ncbi:MAG: hypothetical protein V3U24_01225 [Candidatus Neomarinimicrobiota bacterium]
MKHHRASALISVLAVICSAQSPYNSISHGIILNGGEASSLAQGSVGLVPSHNSRVSYLNPSTWHAMRFAYLTAHYGTGRVEYPDQDFRSEFGQLENIAFVVPIRGTYAWGFGLRPYSRKNFSMEGSQDSTLIFSSDTLMRSKKIDGTGGISSLFTGGSWKIDDNTAVGARLDFLFGVFHEVTSSRLDGGPPVVAGRDLQYRGTLFSVYYRSFLGKVLANSTLYLGGQFPLWGGEIAVTDQPLFLDQGQDGQHTNSDRPLPGEVIKTVNHIAFSLPSTVSLGWVYHLTAQTHINFEISARRFPGKIESTLSSIESGSGVKTGSSLGVGLLRERIPGSSDFFSLFHYRVGFFRRQHYIFRSNGALSEQGFSVGIGIPFGSKLNQLDFGFLLSRRDGFFSEDPEFVRQVSLGVTIGDVWLVKRRRR